jgi:hypothetical protein
MTRPQVADGEVALQIWRGGPPAVGLGMGLTIPRRKNKLVTKDHTKPQMKTLKRDEKAERKVFSVLNK